MNVNNKYLLLIAAGLGLGYGAIAQDQKSKSTESEIVMTKAELESFLNKVAEKKRAQMAKRKAELMVNHEMNTTLNATSNSDERLYRELDRINQRIDMMMMNMGNRSAYYGNTTPQAPTVIYQQPQTQPVVPIYQEVPVPTYRSTPNAVTEKPTGPSDETLLLQRQVNALNEEVRVLTQLSNSTKSNDYNDEINVLKAKIAALNTEVDRKNQPINEKSVVYITENDALKKGLENYQHDIYYANNSTAITNTDKTKLDEVINIVKENDPRVTVVVRGFASKTGKAKYNSELSFNRAEAVKQYLLSRGLNAKNIITMYHGVDQGTNEQHARRAEVTLLVQ